MKTCARDEIIFSTFSFSLSLSLQEGWKGHLHKKLSVKFVNVLELIDHMLAEGDRVYEGTRWENKWILWHDPLSQLETKDAQQYLEERGFGKQSGRQIVNLQPLLVAKKWRKYTKAGRRFELMVMDDNLNYDVECALVANVMRTRKLSKDDPRKFCMGSVPQLVSSIFRTWVDCGQPPSPRICEDLLRIEPKVHMIIDCDGTALNYSATQGHYGGRRQAISKAAAAEIAASKRLRGQERRAAVLNLGGASMLVEMAEPADAVVAASSASAASS